MKKIMFVLLALAVGIMASNLYAEPIEVIYWNGQMGLAEGAADGLDAGDQGIFVDYGEAGLRDRDIWTGYNFFTHVTSQLSNISSAPLGAIGPLYWTGISGSTSWMGTGFSDNGVLVDYALYRNAPGAVNFFEDVESRLDELENKLDTIIELITTPQGRRPGWNE